MKGLRKVHQAVYIKNFNSSDWVTANRQQASSPSAKNFAEVIATVASYFSF